MGMLPTSEVTILKSENLRGKLHNRFEYVSELSLITLPFARLLLTSVNELSDI